MKTNPFKEYFYFIKSDRRAIVALGCVAVFAIGVLMVEDRRPSPQPIPEQSSGMTMRGVGDEPDGLPIMGEMSAGQRGALRSFDPNTVDSITLIGFGLKDWKVRNFLHYRAAGKVFRSAEEMGKTYGWTEEDVEKVKGYVVVGEKYRNDGKNENRWEKREQMERREDMSAYASNKFQTLTKVDVNTADTALLRRIPGVGEKISEAIVQYRKRLGGFYSVEQLKEIKMVSPELLEWFTISSSSPDIQIIHINKTSFQALNSHPYISYEQTKALLQYIRLYGEVKDEKALLETGIFTEEEVEKLRPYLSYE
ncbi:MAG: helix-hairpin-helix domain-containing protein [Bacteroidaceae bacterium]|nr:helix-hairpin-helix domain-containing protein [Bacteroidaceae bacterium]